MLIDIDADTAVELAPHLKTAQLEAMTNCDEFVPILPPFEVYRTTITHGRAPTQVATDVLGVKSAPKDAKLLVEFFARLASETSNTQRDGIFLPKGAATLLGPTTYEQVMQENNFFLTTIATIPVNLEYGAWFAVINTNPTSENEPISLYDHLIRKPWFLRIESVARNKCLIVTTKTNLPEARDWIDGNLEKLIRASIPQGIDPPTSLLPRRLDKPVHSTTCYSYADILKKQFSLISTSSATHNKPPPRKRQATIIDYDSDQSNEYPPLPTKAPTNPTSNNSQPQVQQQTTTASTVTTQQNDFAADLMSIKTAISELTTIIATAMEQIKNAIASLTVKPSTSPSNDMDTEVDPPTEPPNSAPNSPDPLAVINELKQEIVVFVRETRAMFQQQQSMHIPFELTPMPT